MNDRGGGPGGSWADLFCFIFLSSTGTEGGRKGAPERNSQMCDTFLGCIRVKLAQIQNFRILKIFPKWPSHFNVFPTIFWPF